MEFVDVVRRRRSIRKYRPEKVSDEKLVNMFEAVRLAPSGSNRQSWRFIIVRDKGKKVKLAEVCNRQLWLRDADMIVVGCWLPCEGVDDMRLRRDVTIALEHLVLAAANEGLGSCWIGAFDEEAVKSVLDIPQEVGVSNLISIGYSAEEPQPRMVKSLEEIICYDSFK